MALCQGYPLATATMAFPERGKAIFMAIFHGLPGRASPNSPQGKNDNPGHGPPLGQGERSFAPTEFPGVGDGVVFGQF